MGDHPQLEELWELGLVAERPTGGTPVELAGEDACATRDSGAAFRLNEEGLGWSDTIGPWLYSEAMTVRMGAYEFT